MTEKRVGIYAGIDPTAPSMHVGHLMPLMVLFWMYLYGFHACSLVGNLSFYQSRKVTHTCSLEVLPQKSVILLDERLPEKSSTLQHEKLIC